jgi:hypothetical protein
LSNPRSPSRMPRTSRRALLRIAGQATLAAGGVFAAVDRPVAAQDDAASIVGSWIVNPVNPAPGAAPNSTFVSFTPGGGFTRAGISHPTESPGYGAWKQVGDAEFEFTYQVAQFDKQGKGRRRRNGPPPWHCGARTNGVEAGIIAATRSQPGDAPREAAPTHLPSWKTFLLVQKMHVRPAYRLHDSPQYGLDCSNHSRLRTRDS